MSVAAFAGVAFAHLLAAMSPGPAFVLAVRTSILEGFRPALGLAIGIGMGAAFWAFAAIAGLALVFELVPPLFTVLKVAGGIFLVYLAVMMWRHARDPMPEMPEGRPPRGMISAIRLGGSAMLANPKPAIFFGAVFVGLVPAAAEFADKTLVLFNVLWVETAWYVVVAWVFSRPGPRRAYRRAKTAMDRGFGGLLGALGAKVAIS
ncbi:LysE family translocator [Palleronia sp. LCG004]|uniref:LysE family translocator n=1 Tax=Palleronia sp. LCG004 TaxID=3079304 RepID=UPI002942E6A7|nr:LysE family transporter [Palleronia sp. LCG004]WOI55245.1 LysE family transporter [Palleronia sp. LCG004]